jgi:hypothetical protein
MDYRKKINYFVIKLPTQLVDEDRGISECCFEFPVYASVGSDDTWKNDYKLVYAKKVEVIDSITWTISKCETGVVSNLGFDFICPNEPMGIGFIFDWRQYLITYGVGKYTISISFTISGVTGGFTVGIYSLNEYSIPSLNRSIRVKCEFNSYSLENDFDFTNSNAVDTFRVRGIFGFMKPNTQINNLIDVNRTVVKSTRENLVSYELQTKPITVEESRYLIDMLLNEDSLFISDHNSCNHDYQLLDKPVVVEETPTTEYLSGSRLMKLICTFGDRKKVDKSYYNV